MSTYIPQSLKTQIEACDSEALLRSPLALPKASADRHRCCYCLTSEANSGIPMTYDHILPRSKGGATTFENLCLACRTCNEYKSDIMQANPAD